MLKLESQYFPKEFIYSVWLLMAFQAGYVNVGAFFVSGYFVSHVTGTSSNIGMGVAKLDLAILATFATVLLAFIAGAAFAGWFIGREKLIGKDPRYTFVLSVKACFFGLVLLLSSLPLLFTPYLGQASLDLLVIFFLSFCCGVQNSTCALSTDGFLKPTHMTGLSTDIGIWLSQVFGLKRNTEQYQEEVTKNRLRISILGSFIFGGVISTFIFQMEGSLGFLFPFVSSVCFLMMSLARDSMRMGQKSFVFRVAGLSALTNFLTTLFFSGTAMAKIFF